jgi:hypothetical protein
MKKISFFLCMLLVTSAIVFAATRSDEKTTSLELPTPLKDSLPPGVLLKNGKVSTKKGYKLVLSNDKKTVTVVRVSDNIVVGALKCACQVDECEWIKILQPAESTLGCRGPSCCTVGIKEFHVNDLPKNHNK